MHKHTIVNYTCFRARMNGLKRAKKSSKRWPSFPYCNFAMRKYCLFLSCHCICNLFLRQTQMRCVGVLCAGKREFVNILLWSLDLETSANGIRYTFIATFYIIISNYRTTNTHKHPRVRTEIYILRCLILSRLRTSTKRGALEFNANGKRNASTFFTYFFFLQKNIIFSMIYLL